MDVNSNKVHKPKHQNIEQLNDVLDKSLLTMQDVLQSA